METKAGDDKSQALLEHLHRRLPEFTATAPPKPFRTSQFSDAYRVLGKPRPLIVKLPISLTADTPVVSRDRHPLAIEARCLAAFEPGGALEKAGTLSVRPPRVVDFDPARRILVMEDVGNLAHLGDWLVGIGSEGETSDLHWPGNLLGHFIAALHWESFADPQLSVDLDNSAVQAGRLEPYHGAVRNVLRQAGLPDAGELGQTAATLADQLQSPGVCVIQGNLWPPSVLIADDGLRVIDWELAHYGHPAQDVGYLASHLWMHAHRAPTPRAADRARAVLHGFLTTYRAGLGSAFDEILGMRGVQQASVHFGVEILMRTVGAFHDGSLYEGLSADDRAVQEAVQAAAGHIRSPGDTGTFAPLLPTDG